MERNNTTAGTGKPPQILNADPRIDSPQIKVVYPAQSVVQKDLIIPTEIIAPQVVTPIVTPRVETPTVGTVTNVEKATLTDKDNSQFVFGLYKTKLVDFSNYLRFGICTRLFNQ